MTLLERFPLPIRHFLRVHGKYGLYAAWHGKPMRYRRLLKEIETLKAKTIVEIGVYNGRRAVEMIEAAKLHAPASEIEYYGFDLFRSLSEEEMKKEFSKQPHSRESIRAMLAATGVKVELFEGFTSDTLPPFVEGMKSKGKTIDFAFIDGGHARETILLDWQNVERMLHPKSVVVFDDYYLHQTAEELEGIGCQEVVDPLDREMYDVRVYPDVDVFQKEFGPMEIRFARVAKR